MPSDGFRAQELVFDGATRGERPHPFPALEITIKRQRIQWDKRAVRRDFAVETGEAESG